jgi:hypothetical protein
MVTPPPTQPSACKKDCYETKRMCANPPLPGKTRGCIPRVTLHTRLYLQSDFSHGVVSPKAEGRGEDHLDREGERVLRGRDHHRDMPDPERECGRLDFHQRMLNAPHQRMLLSSAGKGGTNKGHNER